MENNNNRKVTSKQVVAMAGVIVLVLMYVITLFLALFDNSAKGTFFIFSLCGTVIVPIVVFFYNWMIGRLSGTKVVGDPTNQENQE